MGPESRHFEELLQRLRDGDAEKRRDLIASVHGDLRTLAGHIMRGQPKNHTLQATGLVSEACMRLLKGGSWADRAHFFKVAAMAMRCVLVDHARRKSSVSRKPTGDFVELDTLVECYERRSGSLPALDEALHRLRTRDPEAAQIVELRFFGGMSVTECAEILGVSTRHLQRRWDQTRAWLRIELEYDGRG